jgi:hypothetical protein
LDQIPGSAQVHFPVGIDPTATGGDRANHRVEISWDRLQIFRPGEVALHRLDAGSGQGPVGIALTAQAQNLRTGGRQPSPQRQAHIPATNNQCPHEIGYH